MRITYDKDADALYIALRDATPVDSIDVQDGITIDLDADGKVTGIEILDAHDVLGPDPLASVAFERLPATAA